MELSEIASVSGKGGLFKVVAPTKSGVILESLDKSGTRLVTSTSHRLSLLSDISIYTLTKEGTVPLSEILKKMNKEFGDDLGLDAESEPAELKSFLKSILPEYDEDKVYISDIKKLVKWYTILLHFAPEFFEKSKETKDQGRES